MQDKLLSKTNAMALGELERDGDLVISSSSVEPVADRIAQAVLAVVPNTALSHLELLSVRSLVLHSISDKRFFDWEMPILPGFTAAEFEGIAEKFPRDLVANSFLSTVHLATARYWFKFFHAA
jgi:hypothetical protein